MENSLKKYELIDKIQAFCEKKQFKSEFVQECITEFIEGHTKLYGDIISDEDLFKRLEENLDKITFVSRLESPAGLLGEYKGRIDDNTDLNEIVIYFSESDFELSDISKKAWDIYTNSDKEKLLQDLEKRKTLAKSTLIHELTHCAYTIKDQFGIGEKHIFSQTGKDLITGEYKPIAGNNNNVEAIVNYISSKIEGKAPDEIPTYKAETKAIYMLCEKSDEKSIIKAAWDSDEQKYKDSFIASMGTDTKLGEKSYDDFQKIMKDLVSTRNQNLTIMDFNEKSEKTLSKLQDVLEGKSYETKSSTFKEIQKPLVLETSENQKITATENKITLTQKIAIFFEKNNYFMNVPFIKNFVNKQLKILPEVKTLDEKIFSNEEKKDSTFISQLTSNVEPIQSVLDKTTSISQDVKQKDDIKKNNQLIK